MIKKSTSRNFAILGEIMFEVLYMNETPLEKLIRERGLKKGYVAERCGISRGTLSLICAGKSEPTLRVAFKLARLFGVSVEDLFGYIIDGERDENDG
jgi:DNA-binding XRE family transcriptional regulator